MKELIKENVDQIKKFDQERLDQLNLKLTKERVIEEKVDQRKSSPTERVELRKI